MRQPLEEGTVTIARAAGTFTYPARFQLVASMNPCPCGYRGTRSAECRCDDATVAKYVGKLSGPAARPHRPADRDRARPVRRHGPARERRAFGERSARASSRRANANTRVSLRRRSHATPKSRKRHEAALRAGRLRDAACWRSRARSGSSPRAPSTGSRASPEPSPTWPPATPSMPNTSPKRFNIAASSAWVPPLNAYLVTTASPECTYGCGMHSSVRAMLRSPHGDGARSPS